MTRPDSTTRDLHRAELPRWRQALRSWAELRGDTRGSATVELVLSIGILILLLWFLVYCGRLSDTRLRIEDVAHQAARAASSDRNPADAAADARSTATTALSDAGVTCQSLNVATSGTLQPGSTVTVSVSCTANLHDLALLQVPGAMTLSAHFASPVDLYRGTTVTANAAGGESP
ncbi:TadE/TadG family type IV pilus assembly protein [Streptantibioticus ferralitis]|uniref:TadE/TadG family type IV pilus assembly protein n=1 Tax=Streptantibioticus ferralitis TaxID=236510 RepID=A0ABT5Z3Y2_9ACTN|nr:TadE/TadG family type IV pilus assembly protein [Streptantibioticus ferralitis]MDF2258377.1 TadE/TadG family type IV pilus assembly protein [Streptantibioticus ferralitis]